MSAIGTAVRVTTEAGDRGDDAGGAPLQEPEHRGPGAGVVGHLPGGERAGVGADQALGGHQDEEADHRDPQRHVEPQRADQQQRCPADAVAARPTAMTMRVGTRPASRAATSVATVSPTALAAKSTEYTIGDSPFIDCSTNAEVAT